MLGFNPEYRSVDMIGTEYSHAYVHVLGCDLFLNPFREYGDTYRVDESTDKFIKRYSNWGQLYVPILDEFVTIWYVGASSSHLRISDMPCGAARASKNTRMNPGA